MIDKRIAQTYPYHEAYSYILACVEAILDDSSSISVQIENNHKADSQSVDEFFHQYLVVSLFLLKLGITKR